MGRTVSAEIECGDMAAGNPGVKPLASSASQAALSSPPFIVATIATSSNAGNSVVAASVAQGLLREGIRADVVKIGNALTSGHIFKISDARFLAGLVRPAGAALDADRSDCRRSMAAFGPAGREGESRNAGALVIEISRGLLHDETTALIGLKCFRTLVSGIVLASGDSYGAAVAIRALKKLGLPVLCVSGVITSSPVGLREARAALGVPVLKLETIRTGRWLFGNQPQAAVF